jgi:hypothetical protein
MGMNDDHREMEGTKNSPLPDMARLTWWKHNKTTNVYENVISKRKIPAAEWKKEYNSFVHFEEKEGKSFTDALFPTAASVSNLTQQFGAVSLGQPGKGAATQPPIPAKKIPSNATGASAAKVTSGAPTAKAPAVAKAAGAPATTSTGSTTANAASGGGTCTFNGATYPAQYSKDDRKWSFVLNGKRHLIDYDTKKKYFTKIDGKEVQVQLNQAKPASKR